MVVTMRIKFASTAAALAGLLLLSTVASAQTGSIAGKVIGEDGKPLQNALIKIDRKDIKASYKVKSNKKGEYFHAGLPLGTYDVSIEVNGRVIEELTMRGVRTTFSGDPTAVDFNLEQAKKQREAMQAAASSGMSITKEQARDMTPEQRAALEKANKEREQALAKNKALNDAFNAGKTALDAKQFPEAIDALTKASELDPKQAVVWSHLAEAYTGFAKTKTGDDQAATFAKAYEAYGKALELKPDAALLNNYALALAAGKKFNEAQAELTKAAQLDPAGAGRYFYNLGALLVNNGQPEPAADAFKKAMEADPNYADAYYQYGILLISKATTTAEGKVIPVAGTKEAFLKYMELQPNGPYAETAKAMLSSMDTTISTEYTNPAAQQKKGGRKK
jgi:tetratricopeptide (TPR) repeat protein